MIEPTRRDAGTTADLESGEAPETVIALGRMIYRFCKHCPELFMWDPTALCRAMIDANGDDRERKHLLERFEDTSAWAMAVLTARLLHEVYAAGGFEEEPA